MALLAGRRCGAQQASPDPVADPSQEVATLRVNSRTVDISAVVRDKAGEPLNGLTKDDFVLKVDGREQPIQHFSVASDLPLTLVLLVDVSGSQRTFIGDEWRASDIFFQTMLGNPADRAALLQVDARIKTLMPMTNSSSRLHMALMQLGEDPAASSRTLLDDAVYLIAKVMLAKEKGRKALVLLTDGGDNGSRATLEQSIEQAQRANVPVYAIDYSAWIASAPSTFGGSGSGGWQKDSGEALLQKMAASTGGRVYTVSNGMPLKKIYEQIAHDLRTQYEVGYTPPATLLANSFHKLELRARDKKLSVQARSGFYVQP